DQLGTVGLLLGVPATLLRAPRLAVRRLRAAVRRMVGAVLRPGGGTPRLQPAATLAPGADHLPLLRPGLADRSASVRVARHISPSGCRATTSGRPRCRPPRCPPRPVGHGWHRRWRSPYPPGPAAEPPIPPVREDPARRPRRRRPHCRNPTGRRADRPPAPPPSPARP